MKRLNYCGLGYYNITQKVNELVPDLNRRVGWPLDTELTLYEEQGSNMVQKILNLSDTLERVSFWKGSFLKCQKKPFVFTFNFIL